MWFTRIQLKALLGKAVKFVLVGVVFGIIYSWSSPHLFPRDGKFGFAYGLAHGALMPIAFPSLIMGEDVEIFARVNEGRSYKLGYIAGINLCGIAFFGPLFWRPAKRLGADTVTPSA